MLINHTFNLGGRGRSGEIKVNSLNVDPVAKVAGTDSINQSDLNRYDMFNVTSAAAASDITLNDDIEVGSFFVLFVGANGCELIAESTGKLNDGTAGVQVVDIAANCRAEIFKHSANQYTVEQVTHAGVRSTPPATAAS